MCLIVLKQQSKQRSVLLKYHRAGSMRRLSLFCITNLTIANDDVSYLLPISALCTSLIVKISAIANFELTCAYSLLQWHVITKLYLKKIRLILDPIQQFCWEGWPVDCLFAL